MNALQSPQRPKVIHLITGLRVGGAERMLARVATQSQAIEHEVFVLTEIGPVGADLIHQGIAVRSLGARSLSDAVAGLRTIWQDMRRRPPAVVQSWLIHANLAAALATPRATPLVWNVRHGLDGLAKERWPTRLAIFASGLPSRRAERIIYNSQSAARQHESLGYPVQRRVIIPNGFDIAKAQQLRGQRAAVRRELGIGEDELLVGFVARVHPIKNHEGLLRAAERLAERYPRVRYALAGVGTEPGGPLAQRFAAAFENRVLWLGERGDVERLTVGFDLACNVSLGEAFSNTVGEAMAAGVPCVVTDVGESARIVGKTGWVAPSGSVADIEAALDAALGGGAAALAEQGSRAAARVANKFSLGSVVAAYDALYLSLASGGASRQTAMLERPI